MSRALIVWLSFVSFPALAAPVAAEPESPEVRQVAEAYLEAVAQQGDEAGRELLLGGATLNAQLFTLENWRIVRRDVVKREQGELSSASRLLAELDRSGEEALAKIMEKANGGEDFGVSEVDRATATRLLAPTCVKAERLRQKHPVLAYVVRVGKEVYWHPKNPMRAVLSQAGKSGTYSLEVHRYVVESREGPRQQKREWPLRVLRFMAGSLDTGWRVLPASDWNAE